jgi:hypothetical protein
LLFKKLNFRKALNYRSKSNPVYRGQDKCLA